MWTIAFSAGLVALAALPAVMVAKNLPLFYRLPPAGRPATATGLSVLIPARDEAAGIRAALASVLANDWPELEVIVMDDHSTDGTREIVAELALQDERVRLATAPRLPDGWNGKQHACWQLSQHAQHELLLFLDADVRLEPDALRRLVAWYQQHDIALLSGFPRQITGSWSERLLIPMMHYVLLGYLPLDQMRASKRPEFGAGCGQLFLTGRAAYRQAGGHAAISGSRHDGVHLPRAYRSAGLATDVFDASDVARVRMYRNWREVRRGLLKNATEGIAGARLIVPFTVLLLGAAVMPLLWLPHALYHGWSPWAVGLLSVALGLSFLPRGLIALRLRQSWFGVVLHPLAVALFVALQWVAFLRHLLGLGAPAWRGRK